MFVQLYNLNLGDLHFLISESLDHDSNVPFGLIWWHSHSAQLEGNMSRRPAAVWYVLADIGSPGCSKCGCAPCLQDALRQGGTLSHVAGWGPPA